MGCEDGEAVGRIGMMRGFHHIVRVVAAQAVWRAESGGDVEGVASGQGVERMDEVCRDRGRMREQGDALAFQRGTKARVGEKAIDNEFHGSSCWRELKRKAILMLKIRHPRRMGSRPIGFTAVRILDSRCQAELTGPFHSNRKGAVSG